MAQFIQKAVAKMKEKGTLGSFGKATPGKIKNAKAAGGLQKKKAVFAENMKKIAGKRKADGDFDAPVSPKKKKKPMTYFGQSDSAQNY